MSTIDNQALHPFYPPGIHLSGGKFVPNDWDVLTLVAEFIGGWVVIAAVTLLATKKMNPRLKGTDQALVLWFVLCGSIHLFFEGYFMVNHTRMASMTDFFGQLWKEYSLSDSRYMFSDPFVLCMESITAVAWGPLSFLTAYLIISDSAFRHPLQALVSTGQFYGDALYYLTSLSDHYYAGKAFYRPEPYYFWFYFVFMNAFWIIVPALCVYSSMTQSAKAFRVMGRMGVNGSAKKSL
ncbi:Delta(8)-Delta(7) sterol isomerase [Hyphodiscus hymeniophilus]|uniref:Delta(8)-Delta(7) sterol isomerase n=1 Tax=Hyphodiscus hymeniophilus TaxID=353542 RepID=A0A9P6VK59_9HELO|nr:Delta(8)-Delta(7) sterol isomerase [Hyphodiscus hymeniophilus]